MVSSPPTSQIEKKTLVRRIKFLLIAASLLRLKTWLIIVSFNFHHMNPSFNQSCEGKGKKEISWTAQ
jgi:hypothetical protein